MVWWRGILLINDPRCCVPYFCRCQCQINDREAYSGFGPSLNCYIIVDTKIIIINNSFCESQISAVSCAARIPHKAGSIEISYYHCLMIYEPWLRNIYRRSPCFFSASNPGVTSANNTVVKIYKSRLSFLLLLWIYFPYVQDFYIRMIV